MHKSVFFVGLSIALLGSAGAASAADCGGSGFNRIACDCGDTLTRSTTLRSSDPVVNNICSNEGLIIGADRIALRCAGRTITGDNDGAGIDIEDRNRVTISGCHITGFEDAIALINSSNNRILRNVLFENEIDGININAVSDRNVVRANRITDNDEDGIDLDFDDGPAAPSHNTFQANFISGNNADEQGDGIEDCPECTGNKYLFNVVQKTAIGEDEETEGNGLRIKGTKNTIIGNRGSQNDGSGLIVVGEDNGVGSNAFNSNGENGICVEDDNRNLLFNRGFNNVGANVAFNVQSCPVGIAPNGAIASASAVQTASSAAPTDDDD